MDPRLASLRSSGHRTVASSVLIVLVGDLGPERECWWGVDDAGLYLVVQEGGVFGLSFFGGEVRGAGVGGDAPANGCCFAVFGDELEGVHAEVILCREARGRGFGGCHEGQRCGMGSQKGFDWGGVLGRVRGGGGPDRAE